MSTNVIIGLAFVAFIVFKLFQRKKLAAAAQDLIQGGALILDVRTSGEFSGAHLDGAHNIPVNEIQGKVNEIEKLAKGKDGGIVVYCASGGRSSQAKRVLEHAGFTQVVNGGAYGALA